ncbi:MAG: energy transducer TonB [Opitutales bacterium]
MKTILPLLGILSLLSPCAPATEPAPMSQPESVTRPCRIIETEKGRFPLMMINLGVRHGTVQIMLEIDETGKLTDLLVTGYSHESFAEEVKRVVREWKFEPALEQGQPISTILDLTYKFEMIGTLMTEVKIDYLPRFSDTWLESDAFHAATLKQLDRIPTPVKIVSPGYPQAWASSGITGSIIVDFYIDATGRTRMATCPAGTNPQLAGIALAAVRRWEFTPPTRQGQPVLVHAQQAFKFLEKT